VSLLGHIGIDDYAGKVTIAVGTVILDFTPYQARSIADEITQAALRAEKRRAEQDEK
jgi:hypothetical protein